MKPYLLGYGVFHFVDGLVSCPPFHVYFECITLLSFHGCVVSRGRLAYLAICLVHS